jgi:hypothetical protein
MRRLKFKTDGIVFIGGDFFVNERAVLHYWIFGVWL